MIRSFLALFLLFLFIAAFPFLALNFFDISSEYLSITNTAGKTIIRCIVYCQFVPLEKIYAAIVRKSKSVAPKEKGLL